MTGNNEKLCDRIIYISGPITGIPNGNSEAFRAATVRYRLEGAIVYNPKEAFPNGITDQRRQAWSEYTTFICNRATTIVMLPGWENSKGARIEHDLADYCGLEIIYYDDAA